MRVFVTGASGWIGSAVVPELLAAGHQVTGLARSDQSASRLRSLGADPAPGSIDDLDSLRAGAESADAVIHLAFKHDFSDFAAAGRSERAVIETFGDALEGSGKPFLFASGVAMLAPGTVATEEVVSPFEGADAPRGGAEVLAMGFAERGIHPVALRFAPTVHGEGDHGFMATLVGIAQASGVAGYVGDGLNRWPAVHRRDAARLVALTLEKPETARVVHAVDEEGVPARDIAEAIGQGAGVPTASIDAADVDAHFGWIGRFFSLDIPASSELTRQRYGWEPREAGLLDDLAAGHYFDRAAA
jgi:nucleoside-diphosphate-sugar epimerase